MSTGMMFATFAVLELLDMSEAYEANTTADVNTSIALCGWDKFWNHFDGEDLWAAVETISFGILVLITIALSAFLLSMFCEVIGSALELRRQRRKAATSELYVIDPESDPEKFAVHDLRDDDVEEKAGLLSAIQQR